MGVHLGPQRGLVPVGGLFPDEGELVRVGLYLRAVEEVGVERDVPRPREHRDDLQEHVFEDGAYPLRAEAVHCVVVERMHAAKPHEVDVLPRGLGDFAARVDPDRLGEEHNLQHHRGVVRGAPPPG